MTNLKGFVERRRRPRDQFQGYDNNSSDVLFPVHSEQCTVDTDCVNTMCAAGAHVICEHPAGEGIEPDGGLCTCASDGKHSLSFIRLAFFRTIIQCLERVFSQCVWYFH